MLGPGGREKHLIQQPAGAEAENNLPKPALLNTRIEIILLALIVVVQLTISLSLLVRKGLFIDDSMHIPAGYSYLLTLNSIVRVVRKQSTVLSSAASGLFVLATAHFILLASYAFHADRIDADESAVICNWFYLTGHFAEFSQKLLM